MRSYKNILLCLVIATCSVTSSSATAQDASSVAGVNVELPSTDDGLAGQGTIRRYDWFRNLWKKRRSEWAQSVGADQGAVVFLGDSITQGWGEQMSGAFGELKVANRGISGDTTRGMLIRLEQDVLSLNPQGVVMLMGTNDLEEGDAPPSIASNVELILDRLLASDEDLSIVLCRVFPSSDEKKRPADQIKAINKLYASLVRSRPRVTLVDTWTLFANDSGDAKAAEFPDLLHPNKQGYEMWASALKPVFATLGWTETTGDDFELEPGYKSLFNGQDLTGWGFRPTSDKERQTAAKLTKRFAGEMSWPIFEEAISFEGKSESSDRRFAAIHDRLVVRTPSEGRRIQTLWTNETFDGDFVLKLEFRATPNADSGVFVRDKQIQCRDYPLAGPYNDVANYKSGDWNELVIKVTGDVAHATCNGEVLEEALSVPKTGAIGLEGDRGQMEYRRIRIQTKD